MERKETGESGETEEYEGEDDRLVVGGQGQSRAGEIAEAKAGGVTGGVGPKQTGQHEAAAGEGIECELHRAVFAVGGTPVRDEEILRDDGDFVEDEEQKRIGAHEHAVHAADQREVEGEKFARAFLDVPGEKNSGGGGESGQHDQGHADAVNREVVVNGRCGDPRQVDERLQSGGRREFESRDQGNSRANHRSQQSDGAGCSCRTLTCHQREQRAGERKVNGVRQQIHDGRVGRKEASVWLRRVFLDCRRGFMPR